MCRRKLEKEDNDRANAFQNRMQKINKIGQSFAEDGAGKIEREERIREEQRMNDAVRRKEIEDAEKEAEKKRKAQANMQNAKKSNEQLVLQKRRQEEKDRADAEKMRLKFQQDAEESKQQEKLKMLTKKKAAYDMKLQLDDQIALTTHNRSRGAKEALSETELQLNKVNFMTSSLLSIIVTSC
jgi:hypothetical protein